MSTSIYLTGATVATMTAIALSFPTFSDQMQVGQQRVPMYQPLDDLSRQLIIDAVGQKSYVVGGSLALFSLISEVALKLVKNSKSLDSDFSKIVDKEFWNLLQ